ncbi:MAG TPA: serine/threonine-protein kinase, partial [Kofleriaceae bacterium]|nr:serine/threonine-protein kinase [Kofleriaceae bacterium]
MSQDTKNRMARTMIGITAPIHPPRPAAPSGPHPAQPTRDPAALGTTSTPTAQLRPQPASPPRGPGGPGGPGGPVGPGGGELDDLVGREAFGYLIRRKLAEGGMGVVYEGVHTRLGRLGAIKVLRSEFCRSEEVVERFHQEARAVNAIRHENIVDIYDFGRDAHGRVCFVMEYLDGEPLSGRIRRGALAWVEAFPILDQTLRALQAAHDKGFVHRDLKPDNIWLRYVDGRVQVKLLDFGIAKLVGVDSPRDKLTQTGSIIGTPHYMSPEQINGSKAIDRRSDLYSLGVIAYEMFAGVTPFVGDTLQAIMMGHLFAEPPRLTDLPAGLGVPAAITDVINRMLVKDPAGRYPSAADVLSDLHDVNGDRRPTHADTLQRTRPHRPSAAPGAAPGRPRRAARLLGIAAATAIAIGGVAL